MEKQEENTIREGKKSAITRFQQLAKSINKYDPQLDKAITVGRATKDRVGRNGVISYEKIMNLKPTDEEWIMLSKIYFNEPQYQRIILYYAALFLYYYYVSPVELESVTKVNDKKLEKEYRDTLKFLDDDINVESFSLHAMIDVLTEGAVFYYYDWINIDGQPYFQITKLPREYCKVIGMAKNNQLPFFQLDLAFIDKIIEVITENKLALTKEEILKQYPKAIQRSYLAWKSNSGGDRYLIITPAHGTAFISYNGLPPFAQVIRQMVRMRKFEEVRDDYIETALQKILFQHVAITKDGDPEIDLALAAEFHGNLKKITKDIDRLNAFTSLADVKVLDLNDSSRQNDLDFVEKFEDKLYNEAGVPQELFDASTAGTLEFATQKDESFMWGLIKQIEIWLSFIVNAEVGARNKRTYNFVVSYLPLSYRNREKMTGDYLKNAQYGYSKLIPQIAVGVKQRHFESLLYLENDLLKLDERLVPLQSSHTQSGNTEIEKPTSPVIDTEGKGKKSNGRPQTATGNKKDGTLAKEASQ